MEENRTETELTPRERRLANLKRDAGPGRPKGRRNFSTIFYDALENLAKKNGMDATQLETEIVEKALLSARKGDARFYKDLMDRVHGTAVQNVDHKTNGKDMPTPIISLDALQRDNSTEEDRAS